MQSGRATVGDASHDKELPQVHAEISAVQFDERLLPIYEEHHRHKMTLEKQEQEDNTKISLQFMADTSEITR